VIVRKFTRDWYAGYASADTFSKNSGLELLDTSGNLLTIEWDAVKWVCYVRELAGAADSGRGSEYSDSTSPERLIRRRFSSRPRLAGLWLRLILSDGDEIEGIAANDRSLVDGPGVLLSPPDTRSNTQRIFLPRSSIREFTVLAVISSKVSASSRETGQVATQPDLFSEERPL
jgi:hypothetical protein